MSEAETWREVGGDGRPKGKKKKTFGAGGRHADRSPALPPSVVGEFLKSGGRAKRGRSAGRESCEYSERRKVDLVRERAGVRFSSKHSCDTKPLGLSGDV